MTYIQLDGNLYVTSTVKQWLSGNSTVVCPKFIFGHRLSQTPLGELTKLKLSPRLSGRVRMLHPPCFPFHAFGILVSMVANIWLRHWYYVTAQCS